MNERLEAKMCEAFNAVLQTSLKYKRRHAHRRLHRRHQPRRDGHADARHVRVAQSFVVVVRVSRSTGVSMTHSSPGVPNPFAVVKQPDTTAGPRERARTRRISLPLLMDDGQVRSFDLPSALHHPHQFSAGELERLTRVYAEALGLLSPER